MTGARDIADDVVMWVRDRFRRALKEYEQQMLALHGGMPPPVLDEHVAQLIMQVEDDMRQDWGGQQVYVHRAGWKDRNGRDASIRADRADGLSLGAIAIKYCISKRQAWRICGGKE
jgi:Mor family transcriptional regulator